MDYFEKHDKAVLAAEEIITSSFTEEEKKGYKLFQKFMTAYEREKIFLNYELQRIAKEEYDAKREETKTPGEVDNNSNS